MRFPTKENKGNFKTNKNKLISNTDSDKNESSSRKKHMLPPTLELNRGVPQSFGISINQLLTIIISSD
jgi:hypothetical protein